MYTRLHTVIICADPHVGISVHKAAARIEEVIILINLSEALCTNCIAVVVSGEIAFIIIYVDEAVLDELAILTKAIPTVAAKHARFNVNGCIGNKHSIGLGEVVFTVKLKELTCHLYAVNGEVQLAVFFNYALCAVFQVGYEHLAVSTEIVHAGFYAVIICVYPPVGILVHKAATRVEDVVIIADLGKALCANVICEVIRLIFYGCKTIGYDISVFIAKIAAPFKLASYRIAVNIAGVVLYDLTHGYGEYDTVFDLYCTIENLPVFITVIGFALIGYKAAALADKQACFFIKVIPIVVGMVVFLMRSNAASNIAVAVDPICTLFKIYPLAFKILFTEVVSCAAFFFNKSTAYKNALIVEGEFLVVNGEYACDRRIIGRVEIVDIGTVQSGTPTGIQFAFDSIILLALNGYYAGRDIAAFCAEHLVIGIKTIGMTTLGAGGIGMILGVFIYQFTVNILCHYRNTA